MTYHGIKDINAVRKGETEVESGDLFLVEFPGGDGFGLFEYAPNKKVFLGDWEFFNFHGRGMKEECEKKANAMIERKERRAKYHVVSISKTNGKVVQTGKHERSVAAMREFVAAMEPSLKGASDRFIRQHWPSMRRNHGVKVEKVE